MAEIDFYLANYNLALQSYQILLSRNPENSASRLRVAQIYYYLEDYQNTAANLAELQPSYEVCILKGSMFLAQKEYSSALDQFLLAESFAVERLRKAEAQSYRAMTLYHLKRYKEASALYLQLSSEKESPDTYMFWRQNQPMLPGIIIKLWNYTMDSSSSILNPDTFTQLWQG